MSHDKMLDFVNKVTKMGLQHFDVGGGVQSGAIQANPQGQVGQPGAVQNNASQLGNNSAAPLNAYTNATMPVYQGAGQAIGAMPGGLLQGFSQDLTAQNNFVAQNANITPGTNAGQLNQSYADVQGALGQQQGVTNTLTPGIAAGAGQEATLAQQLQGEASGVGPNPAQEQYKANVQNAAAQQAGAIASQKGISPALANREIAQQGGAAMQNAAAQGATLQAQQQLGAQNNLQNLSANQIDQGTGAVQGINNAQQNEQNILQGANTAANNALVSSQNNSNSVNASVAGQNAAANNNTLGGLLGGAGALTSLLAGGGEVGDAPKVQHYDTGGLINSGQYGVEVATPMPNQAPLNAAPTSAPQSFFGQWLNSSQNGQQSNPSNAAVGMLPLANTAQTIAGSSPNSKTGSGGSGIAGLAALAAAHGGKVPALVSPGEEYLTPKQAKEAASGKKDPRSAGKRIPGKAAVDHDSYSNDKVPKLLEPGGVVVDLNHMKNKKMATDFVMKVIAAHEARRK